MKCRITAYGVFTVIMKCFIASCGVTLLILFFDRHVEDITIEMIKQLMSVNFAAFLIVAMVYHVANMIWFRFSLDSAIYNSIYRLEKSDVIGSVISGKSVEIITPEQHQKELQITRIHEAGHAVMAYLQGFQVTECIATITTKKIGNTKLDTPDNPATVEQYEGLILVYYAGAVSEMLLKGKFGSGCIGINGTSDFEVAEKLIRNLLLLENNQFGYTTGGEAFENAVRERSKKLFDKTIEILSKHQDMNEEVVNAFEEKEVISCDELIKIFEEVKDERR